MTEQTVTPEPAAEQPAPPPPPAAPVAQSVTPRPRRTFGVPVLAAVAVGTLLVGGLAGGIIGYAVHPDRPDLQMRPGQGPGQFRQAPDGTMPQPPQQGDDSADEVPDSE